MTGNEIEALTEGSSEKKSALEEVRDFSLCAGA
jgi:hypothetical protein